MHEPKSNFPYRWYANPPCKQMRPNTAQNNPVSVNILKRATKYKYSGDWSWWMGQCLCTMWNQQSSLTCLTYIYTLTDDSSGLLVWGCMRYISLSERYIWKSLVLYILVKLLLKVRPKQMIRGIIQCAAGTAALVHRNTDVAWLTECSPKGKGCLTEM